MLQFFKKHNKRDKISQPASSQNFNGVSLPVGVLLADISNSSIDGPLNNFQHDGYETPPSHQSRLSMNLSEALQDEVALSYLSQFAELRGFSHLLNLWLDLRELLSSSVQFESVVGVSLLGSGDKPLKPVSNSANVDQKSSERTCRVRTTSDSSSPITRKKVVQTYFSEDVRQRFMFPEELCTQVQGAVCLEPPENLAFQQVQDFVYHSIRRDLWHDFIRSEFFSKLQVDVLTGGSVSLSDILYHSAACSAFTEFLEQEGCHSVLEFWQTATDFQNRLRPDSDPITAQNEAINIYEKYLSMQATHLLGVDDATRCEVEQRICVEGSAPRSDCLEPALRKAYGYLRYVCLPLFLSSQRYVQLISELMRASRANSSPASSVTDISVESSKNRYDPDLIWRRHHHRGLTIGRIDQLGRFETYIEPEPDKKSESRITRVVKKLVNKEEDKAQEEMAWRVAEMIVKDVTNLTMGGHVEEDET